MKYLFSIVLFFMVILLMHCAPSRKKTVAIIPLPKKIEYADQKFRLKKHAIIGYSDPKTKAVIVFLKKYIEQHGLTCDTLHLKSESGYPLTNIMIDINEKSHIPPEGYKIFITKAGIKLEASTARGLFYAIQTFRQLLLQSPIHKIVLPAMTITDSPRFSWRGMHLDVARHFMPKDFIKKYIDYLAFLKMNTFHWHLVDDQGWRIEIKRYPRLTEIGAWRDSTLTGHFGDKPEKYDGKQYGGYYTQDEIREIVKYAADRFITIVPEIEIPGHSQAAIASYPELGCTGDTVGVLTKWGISPYIYNIDESTFTFLFNVLDEVMILFPSDYIHIGGDEAMKDQWKTSKKIQHRMHQLHIKNEMELQGYFTRRIEEYLESKRRHIIGWDEILEGDPPQEAAVMSWRGTEGGIAAAESGHNVVMTPMDYCYFDHYQSRDSTEPLAIGGFLPIEKVYAYDPVPSGLNKSESELILGTQGNVWTEYMDSPEKVEYMVFPRIFAMAEIQWTRPDKKNYPDFIDRLKGLEVFMIENHINYAKQIFIK
jgi:hexosaminidase